MSAAEERYRAVGQALREKARSLGEFTFAELLATGVAARVITARQLKVWSEAGEVTKIKERPATYRFKDHPNAPDVRETGSLRGNLWSTLRRLRTCTPSDLAAHATTTAHPADIEDAQAFLGSLLRAGYLRCDRTARPGIREAVYRLIRNTGPLVPVLRRTTIMVDPNLGEVTYVAGGAL